MSHFVKNIKRGIEQALDAADESNNNTSELHTSLVNTDFNCIDCEDVSEEDRHRRRMAYLTGAEIGARCRHIDKCKKLIAEGKPIKPYRFQYYVEGMEIPRDLLGDKMWEEINQAYEEYARKNNERTGEMLTLFEREQKRQRIKGVFAVGAVLIFGTVLTISILRRF